MEEERIFEMVYEELKSGLVVGGVWAKAFALSAGEIEKAKAKYILLRVSQIESELKSEINTRNPIDKKNKEKMEFLKLAASQNVVGSLAEFRYWYTNIYKGKYKIKDTILEEVMREVRNTQAH